MDWQEAKKGLLLVVSYCAMSGPWCGCSRGMWGVTGSDAVVARDARQTLDRSGVGEWADSSVAEGTADKQLIEDSTVEQEEGDTTAESTVDKTPPTVVSAFSADNESVTVRFSEPMAQEGAEDPENYDVKGSDNSHLKVVSANLQSDIFVRLTLAPSAAFNPSLTYEVWVKPEKVKDLAGNHLDPGARSAKVSRPVYVAIVWHQHQPMYLDVGKDQLTSPWVRKHATKDYYDMVAILKDYPNVHLTVNLTPVLMTQLLRYYVDRLGPYLDEEHDRIVEEAFLAKWRGRTDPFVDLLLEDTPDPEGKLGPKPTDEQLELFYNGAWSCLSTADALMAFFPQYVELREKPPVTYTHDDLLLLKVMFELAWFDPDFLNGPVELVDGSVVDLTDIVDRDADGRFRLKGPPTEDMANRLLAEEVKIMKNIVGVHKEAMFDPLACAQDGQCDGQAEMTTTPYYHPILPLLVNTDLAKAGQPYDELPSPPFAYPGDAEAQVARAVAFHEKLFGKAPLGMWPAEGSVAEDVVKLFVHNGIEWVATDKGVLSATLDQTGQPKPPCYHCKPYRVDVDHDKGPSPAGEALAIVFRDTGLSNDVAFTYASLTGKAAAGKFMQSLLAMAPPLGAADRLVTIVMDGENAWEYFTKEHDAKGLFHALYDALDKGAVMGEVVPVTVSEYILGNETRGIPPHPIADMQELEPLWPGSWIAPNFSIWVGEPEENVAWRYLRKARTALELSGLPRPDPAAPELEDKDSLEYKIYLAYDEVYAAEGSDWFWWYGDDMTSPANDDTPFDNAFRAHLVGMYKAMNAALVMKGLSPVPIPDFPPIVQGKQKAPKGPFTTPPTVDGQVEPSEPWGSGAGFFLDNDSGAIANPQDDIASVYYGYTDTDFYCAVTFNNDISKKLHSGYQVALYFSHKHILDPQTGEAQKNPANTTDRYGDELGFLMGGAAFEVLVDFSHGAAEATVSKADGSGGWVETQGKVVLGGPVQGGKYLEFAVPFSTLEIKKGDPLEFLVVTAEGGKERDRAPNFTGKVVFEDTTNLVYVTFEVDVSGNLLPIDTYGPINNPPPPKGSGIVYIVGNQDKLGAWIPNKIALRDDGQGGDEKALDQVWTGVFGFMPGTLLRYKYTIGIPKDENKWSGTEEFPLTERGFEVSKNPQCKKMRVSDYFADRPQPSGTLGPHSVLDDCAQ